MLGRVLRFIHVAVRLAQVCASARPRPLSCRAALGCSWRPRRRAPRTTLSSSWGAHRLPPCPACGTACARGCQSPGRGALLGLQSPMVWDCDRMHSVCLWGRPSLRITLSCVGLVLAVSILLREVACRYVWCLQCQVSLCIPPRTVVHRSSVRVSRSPQYPHETCQANGTHVAPLHSSYWQQHAAACERMKGRSPLIMWGKGRLLLF